MINDRVGIALIFQAWLKDRGVYKSYTRNCKKNGYENFTSFLNISPQGWISGAFSWDETPEGSDYWGLLSREWMDICNEKKYE